VLPADMAVRALIDTMAGFTRASGVRYTYCHVGNEGEPLTSYDFGEVPLADAANALQQRGDLADALRMHALNAQLSPTTSTR
jgi:hypothetical protein